MRTVHWLFVVSVLLFVSSIWFLVVGARNAKAGPAAAAPVASVKQLMRGIVVPASTAIYGAVGTTVDASGVKETAPQTLEEWDAVGSSAAVLIEVGNMLLMEGRAKDDGEWATQARAMMDGASQVLKATQARSTQSLLDGGEALNNSCDACHQKYQISLPNELPGQSP